MDEMYLKVLWVNIGMVGWRVFEFSKGVEKGINRGEV